MKSEVPSDSERRHLDIRKYPNRRYYDATRSRHLTLEDIRSLVREGWDVTVTDSKSGADITAQVLTQIILELDTPKLDAFPVPLLLRVIRFNDLWMKEFVDTHFRRAFEAFLAYQKQLDEGSRGFPGGIFPPFGSWPGSFFPGFGGGMPAGPAGPAEPAGPRSESGRSGNSDELRASLDALRAEVEALRSKVRRARAGNPKSRAGGRRRRSAG